ncbi:hypothetical protein [Microbacterium sp. Leaf179]|uniref:hypothetical protein n=1 Tax=Microbacterium sp. Leaf179 TaxID=1736288 RepID=UPI000701E8CC|nr:hypothetical protein [Microbacterium sp. Leaf179]KQR86515.1 hypothetical protein ASF96_09120 [Microbacterium sp. Leaf179]
MSGHDTTTGDHGATPLDVVRAHIRTLLAVDRPLTGSEAAEWDALASAYRDLRRAERSQPTPPRPYRGTDPYRYPAFACAQCGTELGARAQHGILARGRILCGPCLARDDSAVLTLATDRAAAVTWLDQHGLIHHEPTNPTKKE